MGQWVKALATKLNGLSLIPEAHTVEGDNPLLLPICPLTSTVTHAMHTQK